MKNALLVVNVLLVVAVSTLFFLYFSNRTKQIGAVVNKEGTAVTGGEGFRIAYFEMDSIENNYEFFKDVRSKFRNKEAKLNDDLQQLKDQYNKLWEESNQMATKLTDDEKVKRQQMLQNIEERFKAKQSVEFPQLQNESFRDRQEVAKKIQDYLKQYNKEKGFAFIFSSNPDLIFYKDSAYNITNDLIKGLNADYKTKK